MIPFFATISASFFFFIFLYALSTTTENKNQKMDPLLLSGTSVDRAAYEAKRGRTLDPDEGRVNFRASLDCGDVANMHYIKEVLDIECGFVDDAENDCYAAIVGLTATQLRTFVAYDRAYDNEATLFFADAFYKARAVEAFLVYMRLLEDAWEQAWAVHTMVVFNDASPPSHASPFDASNPVFLAFLEHFPAHYSAREFGVGGKVALLQCCLPDPTSAYTRTRDELYRAQQALAHYSSARDGRPNGTPEQVAALQADVRRLSSQPFHSTASCVALLPPRVLQAAAAATTSKCRELDDDDGDGSADAELGQARKESGPSEDADDAVDLAAEYYVCNLFGTPVVCLHLVKHDVASIETLDVRVSALPGGSFKTFRSTYAPCVGVETHGVTYHLDGTVSNVVGARCTNRNCPTACTPSMLNYLRACTRRPFDAARPEEACVRCDTDTIIVASLALRV
jgi:hypothetical protein